MHRICFTMRVHPGHLERYARLHREAWPELLRALDDSGWRNYSLFLRGDGFLVGYLEADDWPAARAAMDAEAVSPRWSVEMDRLVVPGTRMRWLHEVAATDGTAHPADASRAVAVGQVLMAAPTGGGRTAAFRDDDGTLVVYAEHPDDADTLARSTLARPESGEFRRVFDLHRQLAALGERR